MQRFSSGHLKTCRELKNNNKTLQIYLEEKPQTDCKRCFPKRVTNR